MREYNKVIFLDIDGVLVNWSYIAPHEVGGLRITFDPVSLKLLEDFLTENTDVGIILSSTWRNTREGLWRMKEQSAILRERFRWKTGPELGNRGQEIAKYFDNPRDDITHFVVLDDDYIDPNYVDPKYVVKTSRDVGITPKMIQRMKEILND